MSATDRAFPFLRTNDRQPKPRKRAVTEIRGPYYTLMGKLYLEDVLETMVAWVDSLKFAGGSLTFMPRQALRELIDIAHRYDVLVSTGGFIESVLAQGATAVEQYINECKEPGFDTIEVSSGFITIPIDDWLRVVEKVRCAGLKAKPKWASSSALVARRRPGNWRRKGHATQSGRSCRQSAFWRPAQR